MRTGWYLKCSSDDLAPNAIIVGDPARIAILRAFLDDVREVGHHREYRVVTGTYRDVPVSVVATGIGAPAMAIAVEELVAMGVVRIARIGTMMTVDAELGQLILAQASFRNEGTSATYAPPAVPAVADAGLYAAFREVLAGQEEPWTEGLVATFDGFYSQMAPPPGRSPLHPDLDPERLRAWGVRGLDMETSALYVLARYLKVAAISLCAATVDAWEQRSLEDGPRGALEERLARTALACLHHAHTQPGGSA
jgi:uridine phosphorylase